MSEKKPLTEKEKMELEILMNMKLECGYCKFAYSEFHRVPDCSQCHKIGIMRKLENKYGVQIDVGF